MPEEALSKILETHLGREWELVTEQHFSEWFMHLYQKPGDHPKLGNHPNLLPDGFTHRGQQRPLNRRTTVLLGSIGILGVGMWGWRMAPSTAVGQFSSSSVIEQVAEMHAPTLERVTEHIRQSIAVRPVRAFETPPDSFERAVAIAQQAVVEGQVAESTDAWKHLSREWWSAAEFMAEVPPTDARYAIAQDRVNQYRHHSDYAVLETAKHANILPIPPSSAELTKRVSDTDQPERDVTHDDQPYCQNAIHILRLMYNSPHSEEYFSTLPIAGKRGTLHGRFHNTSAYGRVMAKTGTLSGVRALSGYLDHPSLGMLSFSILANHPHQSGYALLPAIDAIVLQVMQLEPCDESP